MAEDEQPVAPDDDETTDTDEPDYRDQWASAVAVNPYPGAWRAAR